MTGRAVVYDAGVIKCGRNEAGGLVTVHTVPIGRHMIVVFAGGRIAVVAGGAVTDDSLMIKMSEGKACRGVTYRAILCDRDMRRIDLRAGACRIDTVMAGRAVVHDPLVIEQRRSECPARNMADSAILTGHHMGRIDLGILAGRIGAVMAGITATTHDIRPGVIHKGIREAGRVVAHRAVTAGVLVDGCRWRSQGAERGIRCAAAVAGRAVSGNARVGEGRRGEAGNPVAIGAVLRRGQVPGCFDQVPARREEAADMAAFAA